MRRSTAPDDAGALEELQRRLAALADQAARWRPPAGEPLRVGGVFAVPRRGLVGQGTASDPAWAAAVVVEEGNVIEQAVVAGSFEAPYQAGYLALRQLPLLERTVRAISLAPAVLLVDAAGRDHPRRAGLAIHLGEVLGIPTAGVTDRPLLATGLAPGPELGDLSELVIDGDLVGFRVRTRVGSRPLCVSAGWRTDPETAAAIVLAVCKEVRTPLPLRTARQLAREARSRMAPDLTL